MIVLILDKPTFWLVVKVYTLEQAVGNEVCPGTEREKEINFSTTDTVDTRVGTNGGTDSTIER